ncbi:FMN-dependent NADH-azoreductase [Mycoplasma procyoni]|uniref:FMN-dependent NADH-azoreductase n=1 Tax=Mycoplasma procyoni TaxID=568784 RepID=UPI00197B1259|nr:FMN-dependent NADH-azoreductase [Mycoplasma procyoni]MBN3534481.1 FMN-dependent NADH-azoreductase [Mycoplasma procyoni]
MKVIVINGSIIDESVSTSKALSDKFIEFYKEKNPTHEIVYLDLNKEKTAQTILSSQTRPSFWEQTEALKYVELLKSANKIVISSPMINFNYSAPLKNFLDAISIANVTFSYKYSKKGDAIGLLNNLKAQVITTKGAPSDWYPFANHTKALEGVLGFLGMEIAPSIELNGTNIEPLSKMTKEERVASIEEQIKKAAYNF